jgi:hypothetical protein
MLCEPQGLVRLERLGKLKKKINFAIGTRSLGLQACSIVPQPLCYRMSQNQPNNILGSNMAATQLPAVSAIDGAVSTGVRQLIAYCADASILLMASFS